MDPSGPIGSRLSPLARAFLGYFRRTRDPYLVPVLLLRGEVEAEVDAITDRLFAEVETELERGLAAGDLDLAPGATRVEFDYDTRLLLPAMLAHGRLHELAGDVPLTRAVRSVDGAFLERGRATTEHVIRALLDGDMRDAVNDEEFEDFETTVRPRSRAAELAQAALAEGVQAWFDAPHTPAAVEDHYTRAVDLSEAHQEHDSEFRDLLVRYHDAEGEAREAAVEAIRERYKFAEAADPGLFEAERDLPYFATQYARVGVLYEEMLNMYEADLDLDLGDDFKRAVVLMVLAAQVGLDDVDDYPDDRGEQLTPVTAELALQGPAGVETVREVVLTYTDRAARYSSDHLTGMAIEYIRQDALDRLAGLTDTTRRG